MFKLKKVELLGFKSFADRTRLEFADGIAAVVGPNGCGKSNLSDAISWVLGEQSAKSLRGQRMSDVIFNGTSARPATSMAEVSLTLIDPESLMADGDAVETTGSPDAALEFPADAAGGNGAGSNGDERPAGLRHRAGEITVTRRLFRSGESEYLINGELCRLRDIQDLFMGTGLGPESYAIIEQGRIGQILSSKPSDRRAIIEEAAGVSKFKTRKRLAEAKLESSRQNLARITDILEEVTKRVNSLKRQASKARRYRELHDELRGKLKVVLTSRLAAMEEDAARIRAELAAAQAAVAETASKLEQLESEHRAIEQRHDELETSLTASREALAQGELERERVQSRIEQTRQNLATLEARGVEAREEIALLAAQLAGLDNEAAERGRVREQIRLDWDAAQQAARELLARQEELAVRLMELEKEGEETRQSVLDAVSRAAELRNQLVQAEETALALERQAARLASERSAAEQEHSRLSAELDGLTSENARGETSLAGLLRAASETGSALEQARERAGELRARLESLREEFSAASARRQALEETLARHAYSTDAVRRLLAGSSGNGHSFQPLGVLADFLEVAPGYEEVVEEFLHDELDCVVVERHEEARSGIALLKSEGTGRSTFFVKRVPSRRHTVGHANGVPAGKSGVIAPLRDLVKFETRLGLNGDLPLPSLAGAYVVESAEAAERLACEYPDCHFLTTAGDHYHDRLVSGGKGSSAGPLALRRDFRELERRTEDLQSSLRKAEGELSEAESRATRLDAELRELNAVRVEAEKKAVVAGEKLRQARETFDRVRERLEMLRNEWAALEAERRSVEERRSALRAEIETAAVERAAREERAARLQEAAREMRQQLDRAGEELSEARARATALEERHHAAEAEFARLEAQRADLTGRRAKLEEQDTAWAAERLQLGEEAKRLQAREAELQAEQQAARERLAALEEEARTVRTRREELNPLIAQARAELDRRRERRSETEVAQARAESDLEHHAAQCREDLSAEPAELLAELAAEQRLTGEALATAENEVRELKTRIENLGPVNMMALEELQEEEQRFQFLETQRQDLLASIADTTQAIREINEVSRRQFLEAFKTINEYFAESFRTLFGGGQGEMRLSDDSDADSGIDIVAQPPGKRLQNVLLLSGGEKALAALAMLIALFRYTPSPFCILDEVDAPLDESNIDRFTSMVRHMSRHTQFILITHNKRTMEIARVMYGVTMEEPGVSKLVSVRFDAAERAAELEPVPA